MKKTNSDLTQKSRTVPKRFLGAFKVGHRHAVRKYIDEEYSWYLLSRIEASGYTDTDSIAMLEYMSKFLDEYYRNSGLSKPDAFHNTDALVKDRYDNYNAIYRDGMNMRPVLYSEGVSTIATSETTFVKITRSEIKFTPSRNAVEDAVLDLLDLKLESENSGKGSK